MAMFCKISLWFITLVCCLARLASGYEMNMTEYFKMPNLYDFDDYDRCLEEYKSQQTYCFVRAEVLPQDDSEAWRAITDISKYHKHHFDHRHLYFGLCLRWCEEDLADVKADVVKELYAGLLTNNSKLNTYVNLFSAEGTNRQRYNTLLNQCINLKLQQTHGLKALSMIEYCETNYKTVEMDTWNLTFYTTTLVLIFLVAASSLFDLYCKYTPGDKEISKEDHYKSAITGRVKRLCVSFSIVRNWYRLNQEPVGKLGRDLRFLDCFKFFCMFLVVFAHTNWILYEGAMSNPQDNERLLHTVAGTLLISGGLITITFFVFSGLLLTINWIELTKNKNDLSNREYVEVFIKFNIFRYLRLTVPYAFVILLSGVYFENPGGPLWRHIVEREQLACRKNWWVNLLYINNYYRNNEKCMLQSWYLASDTFSFMISLLLLILAHKWPHMRNWLFGCVGGFFYVLPGFIAYFGDYDPFFVPSPQTQKDSFIDDREFSDFYAPFHMNFACYFCGVLAAIAYSEISEKQFKLHKNKLFQCLWYALIPIGVLWLLSAHPIYQHYYEEQPRFWNSVYAAIQRNNWGLGLGVFVVGMACKVGGLFRKFSCLPIFRILGRLTYGAFVIHIFVSRVVLGTLRTPLYFGTGVMFYFILSTMVVSYLLSLVLAVLVELPTSALLKLMR
ncbi:nose resistant to fluoxetine protein 6 [Bactrocera tryoni]|uniref:nose resistant to fluoxetine protein 6 n=1 Tax=Bactrocera tryoni TaxID=59916 RepID=UPI001A95C4E4|nr:nose resistant to fluoxetine protein 6 [Bactrocera tryoni]